MPPRSTARPLAEDSVAVSHHTGASRHTPFMLRSAEFCNGDINADAHMANPLSRNGVDQGYATFTAASSTSLLGTPASTSSLPIQGSRLHSGRQEIAERLGNPFLTVPYAPPTGLYSRRDIYPAFDKNGRRIGLEHVRNIHAQQDVRGHYRRRVHEYDSARGDTFPLSHMQETTGDVNRVCHSDIPGQSTGESEISFGGYPPYGRTPHEVLGLPPNAPLNLWSLLDPEELNSKPQYNYHILVKLAILGSKGQKATLQEILKAIRDRFPYYQNLGHTEAIAFNNSIRHLLSLLAAFVREPKPVTEPGKGAYWRVDFSKGEGNKRERKRNRKSQSKKKQEEIQVQTEGNTRLTELGSDPKPTSTKRSSSAKETGSSRSRLASDIRVSYGSESVAHMPTSAENLDDTRQGSVGPQRERVVVREKAGGLPYLRGDATLSSESYGGKRYLPGYQLYRPLYSESGSIRHGFTERQTPFDQTRVGHDRVSGSRQSSDSSRTATPYELMHPLPVSPKHYPEVNSTAPPTRDIDTDIQFGEGPASGASLGELPHTRKHTDTADTARCIISNPTLEYGDTLPTSSRIGPLRTPRGSRRKMETYASVPRISGEVHEPRASSPAAEQATRRSSRTRHH